MCLTRCHAWVRRFHMRVQTCTRRDIRAHVATWEALIRAFKSQGLYSIICMCEISSIILISTRGPCRPAFLSRFGSHRSLGWQVLALKSLCSPNPRVLTRRCRTSLNQPAARPSLCSQLGSKYKTHHPRTSSKH